MKSQRSPDGDFRIRYDPGTESPRRNGTKANSESYRESGFLFTDETAQFILVSDDLEKRYGVQRILSNEHWFAQASQQMLNQMS